jgi:hypothetical protein
MMLVLLTNKKQNAMKKILSLLLISVILIGVSNAAQLASAKSKVKTLQQVTSIIKKGQVIQAKDNVVSQQAQIQIQMPVIIVSKMKVDFANTSNQLPDAKKSKVQKKLNNATGVNSNSGKDVIKDLTNEQPPNLTNNATENTTGEKATQNTAESNIASVITNNTNAIG